MTAAVERGMRLASVEFALDVIGQLSSEGVLTCSLEDAVKMFDFDSVTVVSSRSKASKKRESSKSVKKASKSKITAKPTVILPFCGEIQGDWCKGVKFNHGLHTQCTNGPSGEDTYCKTCRKHADNSATGKPPYGDINDRAEFNVDYRDPKGKLTLPFANVVEKLSINLETANVAAATLGWTIPAEQLVKRSSKRGRPAKSAAVSDSDSDTEETPKKKRGRPSKAKVAAPTQEDQIAQLVAEAYAETKTTKPVIKKVKVKKLKLTAEQKEQAKIAKKEAADKLKAEKKEAADKLKAEKKEAADKLKAEKKEAADKLKAEKKEAADKLKAEKKEAADKIKAEKKEAADKLKAEKAAAILAKKEAALKVKEEKLVAKVLEKEAKDAAAAKLKAEKKAIALKARQEKAAAKKAERDAAKLRKKEAADKLKDEKAEENVVVEELEEEVILEDSEIAELEVDSSDDEEEGETELSETMTVGGVEYFFSEMDGQTILFSKTGEPVGLYDAETDTVQECEFDEE
jgi:hypothetical protein